VLFLLAMKLSRTLKTPYLRSIFAILSLLIPGVLLLVSCNQLPDGSNAFHMEEATLYRGSRPYTLRAVQWDQLGDPGRGIIEKAKVLNQVCRVGGNSVVVKLPRVECATGSPISVWLSAAAGLVEETRKRSMGLILRVDSDCGTQPEVLAEYLAKAFGTNRSILLWIEGAPAAEVLQDLRAAQCANVLLGSASGSDLSVRPEAGSPSGPGSVRLDPAPLPGGGEHYVLQGGESALARLDEVYGPSTQVYAGPADEEGFRSLFDGTTLDCWKASGDPSGWGVEDGTIVWKHPGGGRLETLARFSDFTLRFDWKIEDGMNSGLFIHCPAAGRESRIGMELQLFGDYGQPANRNGTAAVYDVAAPAENAAQPPGEWNRMEVECRGSKLRVELNGKTVQDLDMDSVPELSVRLRDGFIALQDHGDPVAFRNLRIKPLEVSASAPESADEQPESASE
jgi:hypothetical protein